jgi:hypothetical protein
LSPAPYWMLRAPSVTPWIGPLVSTCSPTAPQNSTCAHVASLNASMTSVFVGMPASSVSYQAALTTSESSSCDARAKSRSMSAGGVFPL